MFRKSRSLLFLCCVALLSPALPLSADGQEASEIMELVSETKNCSAKLKRDKNATEKAKKEDKKRRKIGIGEEVTLTLTSKKPALLDPKEKIRWKVTQGAGLLKGGLTSMPRTPESAIFQVNPCTSKEQIQQTGKIVIEVETEQATALPEPIEFEVIFPEQLTAEHETLTGLNVGTPMPEFPQDNDARPSASAMLKVSVHPLDVCFDGVGIIEKDKGYAGKVGSLALPHSADSQWRVQDDNYFDDCDNIGVHLGEKILNETQQNPDGTLMFKHAYPNEFTWNCLFRTMQFPRGDIAGISDVTRVDQSFHIDRRAKDRFYMRIIKFLVAPDKNDKCSVERTSGGPHTFKP